MLFSHVIGALAISGLNLFNSYQSRFVVSLVFVFNCQPYNFRLLTTVRKDSPIYNEMLAILAAVTEVVKAKGGQETVTEYFGALVSAEPVIALIFCRSSFQDQAKPNKTWAMFVHVEQ